MVNIKRFINEMTFTQFLLVFNAVSILVLLLIILFKDTLNFTEFAQGTPEIFEVYCPIQESKCVIETKLGPIELSVDSPIVPLVPFNILLKTSNSSLNKAVLRFDGLDDYMGINLFRFTPLAGNLQKWTLRGSIPVCTIDSKSWRVTLNLENTEDKNFSSYWFKLKIS